MLTRCLTGGEGEEREEGEGDGEGERGKEGRGRGWFDIFLSSDHLKIDLHVLPRIETSHGEL